ncbi:hypothetical protein [Cognatiluteimonas telluris]|uniref:hypothetical protein n=1 Tax=Cognatiluteimonas telluris TaxID=1104775 RepID=UPI0014074092|nr:hypothetical protein [Lysobacter telluris]
MATQSVTKRVDFRLIPVVDMKLLSVQEGVNASFAIGDADCLDDAVRQLLQEAMDDGMDPSVAWLCNFAMQTAYALREAAGVVA